LQNRTEIRAAARNFARGRAFFRKAARQFFLVAADRFVALAATRRSGGMFRATGCVPIALAEISPAVPGLAGFESRFLAGAAGSFGAAFAAKRFVADNEALRFPIVEVHSADWTGKIDAKFSVLLVSWNHVCCGLKFTIYYSPEFPRHANLSMARRKT
jgi:hypothetical protein